ncbi:hypothetical protein C8Q75DRAFT_805202 [Abortiporus biennis]|nr:hypothetical protein C8Q75DRAFT_805202 [Abortiporus biennis]
MSSSSASKKKPVHVDFLSINSLATTSAKKKKLPQKLPIGISPTSKQKQRSKLPPPPPLSHPPLLTHDPLTSKSFAPNETYKFWKPPQPSSSSATSVTQHRASVPKQKASTPALALGFPFDPVSDNKIFLSPTPSKPSTSTSVTSPDPSPTHVPPVKFTRRCYSCRKPLPDSFINTPANPGPGYKSCEKCREKLRGYSRKKYEENKRKKKLVEQLESVKDDFGVLPTPGESSSSVNKGKGKAKDLGSSSGGEEKVSLGKRKLPDDYTSPEDHVQYLRQNLLKVQGSTNGEIYLDEAQLFTQFKEDMYAFLNTPTSPGLPGESRDAKRLLFHGNFSVVLDPQVDHEKRIDQIIKRLREDIGFPMSTKLLTRSSQSDKTNQYQIFHCRCKNGLNLPGYPSSLLRVETSQQQSSSSSQPSSSKPPPLKKTQSKLSSFFASNEAGSSSSGIEWKTRTVGSNCQGMVRITCKDDLRHPLLKGQMISVRISHPTK